jgi:hypothetical protein
MSSHWDGFVKFAFKGALYPYLRSRSLKASNNSSRLSLMSSPLPSLKDWDLYIAHRRTRLGGEKGRAWMTLRNG